MITRINTRPGSTVETCPAEISPDELTAKDAGVMQRQAAKALGLTGSLQPSGFHHERERGYVLPGGKHPSRNDTDQSDSAGGEGTGNRLSFSLRGADSRFHEKVREIKG